MFKSRIHLTHLAAIFAFVLGVAACGGSSADVEAPAPAGADAALDEGGADDGHDDEAAHDDDEAMHDDDEAAHDEDAAHDDDEATHDDEGDGHDGGEVLDGDDVPDDARVVFVTMNEWGYDPGSLDIVAGETIVFRINNAGEFEHEFRLSNAHRIEEHIASGHEGHGDEGEMAEGEMGEGGHHMEDGDIMIELEPGDVAELVVKFPTDMTVFTDLVCLIPDHYEEGMHTDIVYDA
ncbi:MAG: hypothetical protein OEM32_08760 [Acidimicrobiia bacterium]|nr:hypothetical protein [Acidimicrobiia bacterium]